MSLPYFNLYPRDFEADTSHLSLEEDGAYNRLLRLCWMAPECSLPDDDAWIMRRMRVDEATYDRVVRPLISEFFSRKSGRVSNPRLSKEFSTSTEKHGRRVSAGKAGGEAKARKTKEIDPSNATAKPYQPEPEPEREEAKASSSARPLPAPDRFQDFWDQYPHRNGAKKGRAVAEKAWHRAIRAGPPSEIIAGALRYAGDRQVIEGFAKDPATWLNQKGWQDDIEQHRGSAASGQRSGGSGSGMVAAFAAVAARRSAADGRC